MYTDLPGWEEDISQISNFADLPVNAKDYIKFIEEHVGVPVTWIGNGPAREDMIMNDF